MTGNGATVGYGKVFEEEYAAAVADRLAHPTMDDLAEQSYLEYLRRDTAHQVHDGYFSIDKKGHAGESKREKKVEAAEGIGINDDDARRGYDLILKDKERLLSLDEPVRFVFSHSALREGWDNPNIFQICTLKESGSETSKRQEVGRGMRLCVDQDGVRQDAQLLGPDEVQRVNVLTVIASESYETFVRDLQSDIRGMLRERPQKVEIDFFTGRTLEVEGEEVSFSAAESKAIYKYLIKNDFLDDTDRPSDDFRAMVGRGSSRPMPCTSCPRASVTRHTPRQSRRSFAASTTLMPLTAWCSAPRRRSPRTRSFRRTSDGPSSRNCGTASAGSTATPYPSTTRSSSARPWRGSTGTSR